MPSAFPRLNVKRNQTCRKEIVSGSEAPIVVLGSPVGWHVHESEIGIGRKRRPRRNIARPLPSVVFPRFVSNLSWAGKHVELPEVFASASIVPQNISGNILPASLVVALLRRVSDHNYPVDDYSW